VTALLDAAGDGYMLVDASFRPWCSATFIGAQHRITLRLDADAPLIAVKSFAARLPEAELPLAGHVVVDLVVDAVRQEDEQSAFLDLAVLTIEDW
jgi:hypothetical protein